MSALCGRCRRLPAAGVLGVVLLLLAPPSVLAIFPPVILDPKVTITGTPVPPPVVISPPAPPPVVTIQSVSTPEPATLITGLIGIACGGLLMRRKKGSVAATA